MVNPRNTTAQHAKEVKDLGVLILKGEYLGARVKTLYYCPKHDFSDFAMPTNVLKGRGLSPPLHVAQSFFLD